MDRPWAPDYRVPGHRTFGEAKTRCRCPECRAARNAYQRARRQAERGLPKGQKVRQHDEDIDTLLAVLHGYYS